MKVGFTGTQFGMTNRQKKVFVKWLKHWKPIEFHHGDCVGADAEAHALVRETLPSCTIVIHPPDNAAKRAFCKGDRVVAAKPYLERNKDVANASQQMIAMPKGLTEELRSGTWATVRYARNIGCPVQVVWPRRLHP